VKSSKLSAKAINPKLCPCDSGALYSACCAVFHDGAAAPSAENLMRSRYSAYVLGLDDYLLQTWHALTRPSSLYSVVELDRDLPTKWLGLQVKNVVLIDDSSATVEFIARYKIAGKAARMHELSQFSRVDGRWYYVDGTMAD
jgi:SEC-C motif-containing protein